MHVIHCWVREGVAADLDGDDLVVLVDAHAKLCREQVPILIPGRVGSACGQARVGGHITVLPAMQNATRRLSETCTHLWPHCHCCMQISAASVHCASRVSQDMRITLCLHARKRDLHDRYENLFQARQADAMSLFMWQHDITGVARFIATCSERMYRSAGPLMRTRHLISPELWLENLYNSSSLMGLL